MTEQLFDRKHDTGKPRIESGRHAGSTTGEDQHTPKGSCISVRYEPSDEVRDRSSDMTVGPTRRDAAHARPDARNTPADHDVRLQERPASRFRFRAQREYRLWNPTALRALEVAPRQPCDGE